MALPDKTLAALKPIQTNTSNAFAHSVFRERLPQVIRQVQATNDYPATTMKRLDDLHTALVSDARIEAPQLPAPDADSWSLAFVQRRGETWQNAQWFFAETYFFRLLVEAVRYWQTGHDPYGPIKAAAQDQTVLAQVAAGLETATLAWDERLGALFEGALWGNRADLSHPEALKQGHLVAQDDLLIDERAAAVQQVLDKTGPVHVIADNVGAELANDLVLIHALLQQAIPVILHVKMHPTYVSDATVADVHQLLAWLHAEGAAPHKALVNDLREQLASDQWRIAPDFYWNSSRFLSDMPRRIRATLAGARLVILKGDANYRRALNDTIYPVATPVQEIVHYLPAPLLALRTLKSDPLVGLGAQTAANLDDLDPLWRVNGKRGIIQYVGQPVLADDKLSE